MMLHLGGAAMAQAVGQTVKAQPPDTIAIVLIRYLAAGPQTQAQLWHVTKLYAEQFHILPRMLFMSLAGLNGRRVSSGPEDTGAAIAAEAVFEATNISADSSRSGHEEAIERLKKGELDALVYVGGKPARAFDGVTHKDKVHVLNLEYLPALQSSYLPAIITSEGCPNLAAPAGSVATIGIEPAWRWLLANAEQPQEPAPRAPGQQMKTMLHKFVESRTGASTDQDEFFNQFVQRYQLQGATSPQAQ